MQEHNVEAMLTMLTMTQDLNGARKGKVFELHRGITAEEPDLCPGIFFLSEVDAAPRRVCHTDVLSL